MGISFKGEISHKPWELCIASVENTNLTVLDKYDIKKQHSDILYCKQLDVQTNKLSRI